MRTAIFLFVAIFFAWLPEIIFELTSKKVVDVGGDIPGAFIIFVFILCIVQDIREIIR